MPPQAYPQQAYPQQAQPQQAYPQQAYPQQAYPQQAYAPQHGTPPCVMCGAGPTADATFRGHRGLIIVMQFLKQKGPFCRDCGISTFRTMTSRTLVQGWWGYGSFIVTPFVLLINLFQRGKVAKLPARQPDANSGQPLPLGKPVYLRPTMIGLGVPLALVGVIAAVAIGAPKSGVGGCVAITGTDSWKWVACEQTHDGKVISEANSENGCGDLDVYMEERTRKGRVTGTDYYCVDSSL